MQKNKPIILITFILTLILSACVSTGSPEAAIENPPASTGPALLPAASETPAPAQKSAGMPPLPTEGLLAQMATRNAATSLAISAAQAAQGVTPTVSPEVMLGGNWWNTTTFYEIFVRSFKDSNGDGVGDFKGITEMLDYLNDGDPQTHDDLGIGGIWLMPIMPSPSYHGYDVKDYMQVNPQYGTMADFQELIQEAHKRGIKVIIDFVINHTSNEHPWFLQAVSGNEGFKNWYTWSDTKPDDTGPWGQNVWHKASNGKYYYADFDPVMPDLNYHNPMVGQMIDAVTAFWLQEVGVDGFRVDAARYLFEDGVAKQDTAETIQWFRNWRDFLKPINPEAFTVGEVWAETFVQKKYQNPKGLDSLFAFDLAEAIKGGVYSPDPSRIIKAYNDTIGAMPDYGFATFLSNHDQQRASDLYKGDDGKSKQAAFIYLTGPGVPFVYYGEEIGMLGAKPDPNIRRPMQWNDKKYAGFSTAEPWKEIDPDYPERNVELQAKDPDSLLSWYRGLIALRNEHPALANAPYLAFTSNCKDLYATLRAEGNDILLTFINIGRIDQENCSISIEKSPLAGKYMVAPLWGKANFSNILFGEDGSLKNFSLGEKLAGGESVIITLHK